MELVSVCVQENQYAGEAMIRRTGPRRTVFLQPLRAAGSRDGVPKTLIKTALITRGLEAAPPVRRAVFNPLFGRVETAPNIGAGKPASVSFVCIRRLMSFWYISGNLVKSRACVSVC